MLEIPSLVMSESSVLIHFTISNRSGTMSTEYPIYPTVYPMSTYIPQQYIVLARMCPVTDYLPNALANHTVFWRHILKVHETPF